MSQQTLNNVLNKEYGSLDSAIRNGKVKVTDLIDFDPTTIAMQDQIKNSIFNISTLKLIYDKNPVDLFALVKKFLYHDWDNNASFIVLHTVVSSKENYTLSVDDYQVLQTLLRISGGEMPEKTWRFLLKQKVDDTNAQQIVECYRAFFNTREPLPIEISNALCECGYCPNMMTKKMIDDKDYWWRIIKHYYPGKNKMVLYKIPQDKSKVIPYRQTKAMLCASLMAGGLDVEQLSYLTNLDFDFSKIDVIWGKFSPDSIDVLVQVLSTNILLEFLENQIEINFNNVNTIFKIHGKNLKKDSALEDALLTIIATKIMPNKEWQKWLKTHNLNFLTINNDLNVVKHILKNYVDTNLYNVLSVNLM